MVDLAITTGLVSIVMFVAAILIWLGRQIRRLQGEQFTWSVGSAPQIAFWVLVFILLLLVMGAMAGFFGLLLWFASIYIALMIAARRRMVERRSLVWMLTLAAKKGIPMSVAARAFADERRDRLGAQARKLAESLNQGKPLESALRAAGIRLPTDVLVAMRLGSPTSTLDRALSAGMQNWANFDVALQGVVGQIAYLVACLWVIGFVMLFLEIKIVPAFFKIATDFKTPIPDAGLVLERYPFVLLTVGLLLLGGIVTLLVASRYIGMFTWDPPILRRIWRPLDQAAVLRSLALSIEAGHPFPEALSELGNKYPKAHIRRRISHAAMRSAAGADWSDALVQSKLVGPTDVGVLKAAQRVGNLEWALNDTADRQVRRFITRMTGLTSIGFPLALLIAAGFVCVVALAIFVPLISIVTRLAL